MDYLKIQTKCIHYYLISQFGEYGEAPTHESVKGGEVRKDFAFVASEYTEEVIAQNLMEGGDLVF